MANESSILTIVATGFNGTHAFTHNGLTVSGPFSAGGSHALDTMSGAISEDDTVIARFDALPIGPDQHRFQITQLDDVTRAEEVSAAMAAAYAKLKDDLAALETE